MNQSLLEDEVGGGTFSSVALDVAHVLQARHGLGNTVLELVYFLVRDMLCRRLNDFISVSIPSTPGALEPITLTLLLDKFRRDLTDAPDEILVAG